MVEICSQHTKLLIKSDGFTKLTQYLLHYRPDILVDAFVTSLENKCMSFETLSHVLHSSQQRNVTSLHMQVLERLACDIKHRDIFANILPSLLEIYVLNLSSNEDNSATNTRYIIPKRGGLFSKRHVWLDDIPPLQGTLALTKVEIVEE